MVIPSTQNDKPSLDPISDKYSAVFVKELRQMLNAKRFTFPFLALHLIALLIVVGQFSVTYFAEGDNADLSLLNLNFFDSLFNRLFHTLLWLIIGIIMPLSAINSLQQELSVKSNSELLLMAGLSRWQIVLGKWQVPCALSTLIIISILPYMLTTYFIGGVDLLSQLKTLSSLWLFNIIMTAAVVGSSGYRNLPARVILIGLIFFSLLFTSLICLSVMPPDFLLGWNFVNLTISALLHLLLVLLYVSYSLQFGRASLQLHHNPLDPPVTASLIVLLFFIPLIIGMCAFAGKSLGCLIGLSGFLIVTRMSARNSIQKNANLFNQP